MRRSPRRSTRSIPPAASPHVALTRRELEVQHLLAAGLTNTVIAESLFIDLRTIENHVVHIFAKLGVTTHDAAVDAAIAARLIPSPAAPVRSG